MLEGAGHAGDLGGTGSGLPCRRSPGRCRHRYFLDDGARAIREAARVLPVLRHAVTLGVPVSIDTVKPAVMQAALDLGADIVNDIWALRQPGAGGSDPDS